MLPADERFHAGHPARAEVDLGLEVEDQLLGVKGVAQVSDKLRPLRLVAGLVDHVAGIHALGGIHGRVSAAEKHLGIFAMLRKHGHTDAGAHFQAVLVHEERVLKRPQHLTCREGGAFQRGGGEQQGELIAAEAGHGVGCAQDAAQALTDLLE
jgi:hypothetical protein